MNPSRSLLDFIETPIIVGDPDGCAVFANPAFQRVFGAGAEGVRGQPLAGFFQGGAREAVLGAVARVCGGSLPVRFRLREGGVGWSALASPIEVERGPGHGPDRGRVGVVILLCEEVHLVDVGPARQRELQEPLEEVERCLAELSEGVGGRRDARFVAALEDAVRAVGQLRKCSEQRGARGR